jgi:hypothetical protein
MASPSQQDIQSRSLKKSQPGDFNPKAKESEISWHTEDVGDGGFGEGPLGPHYFKSTPKKREAVESDYSGLGPRSYQRSDQRIYEDVCEILTRSKEVDAREIEISVDHGEVTLMGTVSDHRMKLLAEKCIEDCPGILETINQLRVRSEGGSNAQ